MSRPKRTLRRKYIVFCEGDTEYNYIDEMRKGQGVELALKPINMRGGGYTNFLEKIKTEPDSNCLARFVIVDMDRALGDVNEERCLKELIEYCRNQNKKECAPYFLIVDNPDFEYVACLHNPAYHGCSTKNHIEKTLGFGDLDKFKATTDVYHYLNTNGNSSTLAMNQLRNGKFYVRNRITNAKVFDMKVVIEVDDTAKIQRGSNFFELFDIIGWEEK